MVRGTTATALSAGLLWLLVGSTADLRHDALAPGAGPAELLTLGAAASATVLLAWLVCCLALAHLGRAPGLLGHAARRALDRVSPSLVRQLVAAAVGTATVTAAFPVTAAAASVRSSTTGGPSPAWTAERTGDRMPAMPEPGFRSTTSGPGHHGRTSAPERPGWVPSAVGPRSDMTVLGGAAARPSRPLSQEAVVVRLGDTLWDVAARHLGPGAGDLDVARAWPRWYATNRDIIGPDPDLLLPGTRLTPPSSTGGTTEAAAGGAR